MVLEEELIGLIHGRFAKLSRRNYEAVVALLGIGK